MSELTDEELDRRFRALVDELIDSANAHCAAEHKENVGLAMLYAAARFNAFVVASHAENLEKYQADYESARDYFVDEYRRMLVENLQDYESVLRNAGPYAHLMKSDGPE